MADADQITALLDRIGLEHARDRTGAVITAVPCEARGALRVALTPRPRGLALEAFVMRAPDRGHEEVYRRVLRKHLDSGVWRFALDGAGDLFAVAQLPGATPDAAILDEALAALSLLVDASFEGLVRTGFAVPDDVRVSGPAPAPGGGSDQG